MKQGTLGQNTFPIAEVFRPNWGFMGSSCGDYHLAFHENIYGGFLVEKMTLNEILESKFFLNRDEAFEYFRNEEK